MIPTPTGDRDESLIDALLDREHDLQRVRGLLRDIAIALAIPPSTDDADMGRAILAAIAQRSRP